MNKRKEGCHHDNLPFINLKSNTMKNTLQRYAFLGNEQVKELTFCSMLSLFNTMGAQWGSFVNEINQRGALFHIKNQTFQVFPFRMIDVDGMVGRLVQLM